MRRTNVTLGNNTAVAGDNPDTVTGTKHVTEQLEYIGFQFLNNLVEAEPTVDHVVHGKNSGGSVYLSPGYFLTSSPQSTYSVTVSCYAISDVQHPPAGSVVMMG
jgi:hypothetical protein